jgi:hypothetical protein
MQLHDQAEPSVVCYDYVLYIAISEPPNPATTPQPHYEWQLVTDEGKILKGNSGPSALRGSADRALFPAFLHAVKEVGDGTSLLVVSDAAFFVCHLNDLEGLKARNYRRKGGKGWPRDADNLKDVVRLLEERRVMVRGLLPQVGDHYMDTLNLVKDRLARRIKHGVIGRGR